MPSAPSSSPKKRARDEPQGDEVTKSIHKSPRARLELRPTKGKAGAMQPMTQRQGSQPSPSYPVLPTDNNHAVLSGFELPTDAGPSNAQVSYQSPLDLSYPTFNEYPDPSDKGCRSLAGNGVLYDESYFRGCLSWPSSCPMDTKANDGNVTYAMLDEYSTLDPTLIGLIDPTLIATSFAPELPNSRRSAAVAATAERGEHLWPTPAPVSTPYMAPMPALLQSPTSHRHRRPHVHHRLPDGSKGRACFKHVPKRRGQWCEQHQRSKMKSVSSPSSMNGGGSPPPWISAGASFMSPTAYNHSQTLSPPQTQAPMIGNGMGMAYDYSQSPSPSPLINAGATFLSPMAYGYSQTPSPPQTQAPMIGNGMGMGTGTGMGTGMGMGMGMGGTALSNAIPQQSRPPVPLTWCSPYLPPTSMPASSSPRRSSAAAAPQSSP
ncbi:MAG: hypothetical protein M1818_000315 [Claussenomyces sp. TS43310]|nr:MAG: hypothetical protein M1818_000315 [Claussenomyces sp. TS43310]